MQRMRSLGRCVFHLAVGLSFAALATTARAQTAPMGDHTGGRSSDTGHAGEVNATGGYSTSIPLDLPATRSGLGIPLSIVSGGHQVGAAGVGWDIPLSYVRVDTSIAKRKPMDTAGQYAVGRTRVVLSLGGEMVDLVHHDVDTNPNLYVAQRDGALITAIREASDWAVYDGKGHEYEFFDVPGMDGLGLSLLRVVNGPTGTEMTLTYDVHSVDVSPGASATVVDLSSISYNYAPVTGCGNDEIAKNEIDLNYGTGTSPPLSVSMLSGRMFARDRLVDNITVQSRTSCGAATTLRTYKLDYSPDPITHQSWLLDAKMYGRGAIGDTTPLPLGTFHYNTGTDPGGISYQGPNTTAAFPAGANPTQISSEVKLSTSSGDTTRYNTPQNLLDVTGDGIPDFVFAQNGVLWSAKGIALPGGGVSYGTPAVLGDNGIFIVDSLEDRTVISGKQGDDPYDLEQIWKEAIDVNGDGRIDIVDAWSHPNEWTVYLNTPSTGPSGVAWQMAAIDTSQLAARVGGYHDVSDGRIALARRYSGVSFTTDYFGNPVDDGMGPVGTRSFTEWEVKDINGDGFPDFVLNSTAARFVDDASSGGYSGDVEHYVTLGNDNDVEVMFNVGGVIMEASTPTFAKSLPIVSNNGCGVEEWEAYQGGTHLLCTFADLTGDGIPDRIDTHPDPFATPYAWIGRGDGFGASPAEIELPVMPGDFYTPLWNVCASDPGATFPGSLLQTVRDVTGDGIPDLVGKNGIYIGTGTGFSGLVPTQGLSVSDQIQGCDGGSYTYAGLYDVDGDGRPELAAINGAGNLDIIEPMVAGAPLPEGTGRLASIDNGYGATTYVSYRSAKTDPWTPHQVPFPEVVVSATWTATVAQRVGSFHTDYAYGNASMIFSDDTESFIFPGYLRTVSEQASTEVDGRSVGQATITDKIGLSAYVQGSDQQDLYARQILVGRTSQVTKLAGVIGNDPDALLLVNANNDSRIIATTTYQYGTRLFTESAAPGEGINDCLELAYPYDYVGSLGFIGLSYDTCSAHGFAYVSTTRAQRGSPTSTANVTTQTEVTGIDDYARPTSVQYLNDVARGDDDLCVDTTYASFGGGPTPPIQDAVATSRTSGCSKNPVTYAYETFQYDGYSTGTVTTGFLTSKTSERHSGDDGSLIAPAITMFDATYDALGNVVTLVSARDDGAIRGSTFTYDPFGMVVTSTTINASGLPSYTTSTTYDLATLEPIATIDPTKTTRGATYDPFGRVLTTTVTPFGGATGALSSISYLGFTDGTGRRVAAKTFDDPVDPNTVDSATGHVSTTYLDELGRPIRTESVLGADYAGQTLVTGYRAYDSLGRVAFAAAPYLSTDDPRSAEGITPYYNADGTTSCVVEAAGPHAYTAVTDPTNGVYPTCYYHGYSNYLETFGVSTPDANLPGSPQAGVLQISTATAIGRRVSSSTSKHGTTLEYTAFAYDRPGHLTAQARYETPATLSGPVITSWHYDSFGLLLRQQEPEGVLESHDYDSWGELVDTYWFDAGVDRRIVNTYDALGRALHREERNGGITDPETVDDFVYDNPIEVGPEVTPTNVLGRLSRATSPTGSVTYSYDAYGTVNAETHVDASGTRYVQTTTARANGVMTGLDFYLPDTGYEQEHVDYAYDSASRAHAITYQGAAGTVNLYKAGDMDAFGHVLEASYGGAKYQATFETSGRRQLREAQVSSVSGLRDYKFPSYDPIGRELARDEVGIGTSDIEISESYDALGRLQRYNAKQGAATTASWLYTYDALGNLVTSKDGVGTAGSQISLRSLDGDEACRVEFPLLTGSTCNVSHDVMGNIAKMPERSGLTRTLKYFDNGNVKTITDKQTAAGFRYDAFGDVQEVTVKGGARGDRDDRHYGANIEVHQDVSASFIMRKVPGPGGMLASLRGPSSNWVLSFGEGRGLRVTTDIKGKFLQDLSYQPFGETKSTGVTLGSPLFSNDQWNGGDALADFGLVHIGARVYDPVIGRFLSRDPIRLTHSENASNPYSFAQNDPINGSDPSGMCDEGDPYCGWLPPQFHGAPPAGHDVQPHGRPVSTTPAATPSRPSTASSYTDSDSPTLHNLMFNGRGGLTQAGMITAVTMELLTGRASPASMYTGAVVSQRLRNPPPVTARGLAVAGAFMIGGIPGAYLRAGLAAVGSWLGMGGGGGDAVVEEEEGTVIEMEALEPAEGEVGGGFEGEAETMTQEEALRPENINPTNGTYNCGNACITADRIMGGAGPASAVPSYGGMTLQEMSAEYGNAVYRNFDTLQQAKAFVQGLAPGARAIVGVRAFDPRYMAHFVNLVNEGGVAVVRDTQGFTNESMLENLWEYSVLITHGGG